MRCTFHSEPFKAGRNSNLFIRNPSDSSNRTNIFIDTVIRNRRIIIGVTDTAYKTYKAVELDSSFLEASSTLFVRLIKHDSNTIFFLPVIVTDSSLNQITVLDNNGNIENDKLVFFSNELLFSISSYPGQRLYGIYFKQDVPIFMEQSKTPYNFLDKNSVYADINFIVYPAKNSLLSIMEYRYRNDFNAQKWSVSETSSFVMKKNILLSDKLYDYNKVVQSKQDIKLIWQKYLR